MSTAKMTIKNQGIDIEITNQDSQILVEVTHTPLLTPLRPFATYNVTMTNCPGLVTGRFGSN